VNDLGLHITNSFDSNELLEYIVENRVDLVVAINQNSILKQNNLKNVQFLDYKELNLDSSCNKLTRKSINMKLDVRPFFFFIYF